MIRKFSWLPPLTTISLFRLCRPLFHSLTQHCLHSAASGPIISPNSSYMELSQDFADSMKSCTSASTAQKVHARLISCGIYSSIFIQNHLLHMYFNCRLINDACRVFDEMQLANVFSFNTMISGLADYGQIIDAKKLFDVMLERDTVSWNSMMSGYFNNGLSEGAVKVFVSMVEENEFVPDPFSLSCVMKACGSLRWVKFAVQLHGLVYRYGFVDLDSIGSSVIDMYIKCDLVDYADRIFCRMQNPSLFCWNSMLYAYSKSCGIEHAFDLFEQIPERDTVSWNSMISLLSQHGFGVQCIDMFVKMWLEGFRPNSRTYGSVLSACSSLFDLDWGRHLHARIVKMEFGLDAYTRNGLIDLYAKCGSLDCAKRVFDSLDKLDVVSFTSLIAGVAQFGTEEEALLLFNQMRNVSLVPDPFTIATVLGVCSSFKNKIFGMQLQGYIVKTGMDSFVPVGNALISMYANSGYVRTAILVFDWMPLRDIISWTAAITALSQNGDVHEARLHFDKMPMHNIVTWNSMLTTYVRHGFWEEGIKLYILMLRQGIKPDWITLATSISACADAASLQLGKQLLAHAEKIGLCSDVSVANGIITMYSRCANIHDAEIVFESIATKNLVSWNSMMAGYAQNGWGRKVIEIFESMIRLGCQPDHISFVSVLTGCSHAGLVQVAHHYFTSMIVDHGICPVPDHFTCMVDLLGRAGFLGQAKELINGMPFEPNSALWKSLLSACCIHGDTELAELAAVKLLELEGESSGGYTLLANAYSASGKLEDVASVRKMMKNKGIKKNPGCSWIEVNNVVHVFTAYDTNHPQINDVLQFLEVGVRVAEDTSRPIIFLTSLDPT